MEANDNKPTMIAATCMNIRELDLVVLGELYRSYSNQLIQSVTMDNVKDVVNYLITYLCQFASIESYKDDLGFLRIRRKDWGTKIIKCNNIDKDRFFSNYVDSNQCEPMYQIRYRYNGKIYHYLLCTSTTNVNIQYFYEYEEDDDGAYATANPATSTVVKFSRYITPTGDTNKDAVSALAYGSLFMNIEDFYHQSEGFSDQQFEVCHSIISDIVKAIILYPDMIDNYKSIHKSNKFVDFYKATSNESGTDILKNDKNWYGFIIPNELKNQVRQECDRLDTVKFFESLANSEDILGNVLSDIATNNVPTDINKKIENAKNSTNPSSETKNDIITTSNKGSKKSHRATREVYCNPDGSNIQIFDENGNPVDNVSDDEMQAIKDQIKEMAYKISKTFTFTKSDNAINNVKEFKDDLSKPIPPINQLMEDGAISGIMNKNSTFFSWFRNNVMIFDKYAKYIDKMINTTNDFDTFMQAVNIKELGPIQNDDSSLLLFTYTEMGTPDQSVRCFYLNSERMVPIADFEFAGISWLQQAKKTNRVATGSNKKIPMPMQNCILLSIPIGNNFYNLIIDSWISTERFAKNGMGGGHIKLYLLEQMENIFIEIKAKTVNSLYNGLNQSKSYYKHEGYYISRKLKPLNNKIKIYDIEKKDFNSMMKLFEDAEPFKAINPEAIHSTAFLTDMFITNPARIADDIWANYSKTDDGFYQVRMTLPNGQEFIILPNGIIRSISGSASYQPSYMNGRVFDLCTYGTDHTNVEISSADTCYYNKEDMIPINKIIKFYDHYYSKTNNDDQNNKSHKVTKKKK